MGNSESSSYPDLTRVPLTNFDKWEALGVKVERAVDSNVPYCQATFPEGWTCVSGKNDQRSAIYYDPQGIPRVQAFIKAADYDPFSSCDFWSQETSDEFVKEAKKKAEDTKRAEEERLAIFAKFGAVQEWSTAHTCMVYLFRSGRHRYEEYYAGIELARRGPRSNTHEHKLVAFVAEDKKAGQLIDELIRWQEQHPDMDKHPGYMYCQRHLPAGLSQLDRHEYAHITGIVASHSHPSNHVCLGPKGDCAQKC